MITDKLGKFGAFYIGAGVFGLVIALIGYMVYVSVSRYSEEKTGFSQALGERKGLHARSTYPSEENIKVEQDNQRILADKFSGLMDSLYFSPVEMKSAEPTVFMSNLESARMRMKQMLAAARVRYPDNFQYAFGKYVGGILPHEDDVPKLAYQLYIIETFCRVLSDAKAASWDDVTREEFEASGRVRSYARGQPDASGDGGALTASEEEPLFTKMKFSLRFQATEASLMTVLNNLASNQLFTCVSRLRLANPKESKDAIGRDFTSIEEAKANPVRPPADIPSRDKRLTMGREELIVTMDVGVYRFAGKPRKADDSKGASRATRDAQPPDPEHAAAEPKTPVTQPIESEADVEPAPMAPTGDASATPAEPAPSPSQDEAEQPTEQPAEQPTEVDAAPPVQETQEASSEEQAQEKKEPAEAGEAPAAPAI